MQTPADNISSEDFGDFPQGSEDFRSIPKDSEDFRSFPNRSERKENHILTVHAVARMFEDAGVARTERSITNWCQPDRNGVSRLDAYFDTNERRYYITPQSVERAIAEEKSKTKPRALPHDSEDFRTVGHGAESRASEQPVSPQNEQAHASPDQMKEIENLRRELLDSQITNKAKDYFIEQLREERQQLMEQALDSSKRVGELETKLLQLESPRQTTAQHIVHDAAEGRPEYTAQSISVPVGDTQP